MKYSFILFGIVFGFLLSRAGATTYDNYSGLFLLQNFQLLWVIVFAIVAGTVGLMILKKAGKFSLLGRETLLFDKKPMKKGFVSGALLFGIGWGLAGSCPGTAPAMLGEGKIMAVFSILGIVLGTYLYGYVQSAKNGLTHCQVNR